MPLPAGTRIDRYVVEHLLGEGGMAEVYCVRHDRLGSRYALKILVHPTPYLTARLLKEGRAQSQLQHPYLLPVRDVLTVEGRPALLMPLVQGPTLGALLQTYRPTPGEALALFRCIAEGLAFAHQRGVVHRDLKPGNVLLEVRHGRAWPLVADFGLVKMEEEGGGGEQTADGAAFGTPAYAAPEQLRDASRVTLRADLFSLGVVLAEVLTGARPFAGDRLPQVLDAHRLPPRLEGLDGPLRGLIEALLQMEPEARPASCEAVLAWLPPTEDADLSSPALLDALQRAGQPRAAQGSSVGEATFAPLRHNLAPPRDRFVGRQQELALLRQHLSGSRRLVTLLGPGGVGKSRLALELGWATLSEWPGGVWFCALAEARTAEGALAAVAAALDVPLGPDPEAQLADGIRGRGPALLILDNFEQIAPLAAQTVGRWLDRAPEARFVVTSREPLRLRGEQVVALDVLAEDAAVSLLAERARQANDRFSLSPAEEPLARALVALLDRLPLAIELAAARARLLSLPELLARMAQRFSLLASRSPDLPPRQRTMQAALEWSWDLLDPPEQAALARCSVFEGGFTLEAAEAVIEAEGWAEEILAGLADKSLLVVRAGRLSMLASVQQFARDKLRSAPPVELRHCRFFARMGEPAALEALHRPGGIARGWALAAERDNLIAAARRAAARGEADLAARCALAAAEVFEARGPLQEGLDLLALALQMPDLPADLHARLLHREGALLRLGGQPEQAERALRAALDLDEREGGRLRGSILLDRAILLTERGRVEEARRDGAQALDLARAAADRRLEGLALGHLGGVHYTQGRREEALEHLQRALDLARAAGDRRLEGVVLGNIGILHYSQGRMEEAARRYRQALSLAREAGTRRFEGNVLGNLGVLYAEQGRVEEARAHYQQALDICREIGNRPLEGRMLGNLGRLHAEQGRAEEARAHYQQALALAREVGNRGEEGNVLGDLGVLYAEQGRAEEARAHYQQALDICREVGNRRYEGIILDNLASLLYGRGQAEEALGCYEQALAIYREVGDRRLEGITLNNLGDLHRTRGRPDEARRHLEQALRAAREVGDRRFEGIILGSLGSLRAEQGRAEEALDFYEHALSILREVGDRRFEGIVLGDLGQFQGARGGVAAGRASLRQGEALLREVGAPAPLALLLCKRAALEAQDGQPDAARASLEEARGIAGALGVAPGSELERALRAAGGRLGEP